MLAQFPAAGSSKDMTADVNAIGAAIFMVAHEYCLA
jgi:hypothetical protein